MTRTRNFMTTAMAGSAAAILTVGLLTTFPGTAHAGKGVALIGGLIGGHVLTNMANRSERRTRADEYRAYNSRPANAYVEPAQQVRLAPASNSGFSVQDRLDTLDKLAAAGMITKEEYQTRRQAIINSL